MFGRARILRPAHILMGSSGDLYCAVQARVHSLQRSSFSNRLLSSSVSPSSSSPESSSLMLFPSTQSSYSSSSRQSSRYTLMTSQQTASSCSRAKGWQKTVVIRNFSTNEKDNKENAINNSSNDNSGSSSSNSDSNKSSSSEQSATKASPDDLEDKYSAEELAEMEKNNSQAAAAAEGKQEGDSGGSSAIKEADYDEYYEDEPQTKEGKFRQGFKAAGIWALILTGIGCIVYLGRTMIGKHSVNGLFSNATDSLKASDEIRELVGDNIVAFGRDQQGNQGRRNMIDSYEYDTEDGDKRLRIRFHIEGTKTKLRCWAEVSDRLSGDSEYAYLICQDMKTGRVITIQDNRQKIDDMKSASGNTSLLKAFDQLRAGGSGGAQQS